MSDSYIGLDGVHKKSTSQTTLVCFHDLLGFGEMVSLSGGSLDSAVGELCKKRISSLRQNIGKMEGEFPVGTKLFQMNDSAIAVCDIDHYIGRMHLHKSGIKSNKPSKSAFLRVCQFLVASSKLHMSTEFTEEHTRIGPAGRTIVVAGHRWPIDNDENDSVTDVPELQANLAFSEAYLMDAQGAKVGLKGMSMYINDLYFWLLKLGAEGNPEIAKELISSPDITNSPFPAWINYAMGSDIKTTIFHREVEYKPVHSHMVSRMDKIVAQLIKSEI